MDEPVQPVSQEVAQEPVSVPAPVQETSAVTIEEPTADPMSIPPPHKKAMPVIVAVVILFVLAGGAYALYTTGILDGGSPASFAKAYTAYNSAKTIHIDETLAFDFALKPGLLGGMTTTGSPTGMPTPTPATPALTHMNIGVKGDVDKRDSTKPKLDVAITAVVNSPGLSLTYDANARLTSSKDAYVKLNSFPGAGFLPTMPLNQWIHIPITSASQGGLNQLGVTTGLSTVNVDKTNAIKGVLDSATLLQLTTRTKGPTMAGESTEDLGFTVPKENLVSFINNLSSALGDTMDADAIASLTKTLGNIQITGDMVIGRKTQLPYKVTYRIIPDATQLSQYLDQLTVSGTMTFADYDKPFMIEVPAGAIESDTLFNQSTMYPSSQIPPTPRR